MIKIKLKLAISILIFLMMASVASASPVLNEKNAIKSIIGEAENQGYEGMLAVACAIRNRGTLKGVFGLNNPRVKKHLYSAKIESQAVKAWQQSVASDITGGATHWENIKAFGKPYWVASMTRTVQIKDHIFYKSKRG